MTGAHATPDAAEQSAGVIATFAGEGNVQSSVRPTARCECPADSGVTSPPSTAGPARARASSCWHSLTCWLPGVGRPLTWPLPTSHGPLGHRRTVLAAGAETVPADARCPARELGLCGPARWLSHLPGHGREAAGQAIQQDYSVSRRQNHARAGPSRSAVAPLATNRATSSRPHRLLLAATPSGRGVPHFDPLVRRGEAPELDPETQGRCCADWEAAPVTASPTCSGGGGAARCQGWGSQRDTAAGSAPCAT